MRAIHGNVHGDVHECASGGACNGVGDPQQPSRMRAGSSLNRVDYGPRGWLVWRWPLGWLRMIAPLVPWPGSLTAICQSPS
jgi:hypothetical protein